MRRSGVVLVAVMGIVLVGCVASAPTSSGTIQTIEQIYSAANGSRVSATGVVLNLQSRGEWANFDIRDATSQIHVFWRYGSNDHSWLANGRCVDVVGEYQLENRVHYWEPQIEAEEVYRNPGGCAPPTTATWQFVSYGGAEHVAGSCHLVRTETHGFLVDCGSYMNTDDMPVAARSEHADEEGFTFGLGGLRAVVITHAHDDHIGRLHYLVHQGYDGPVYMTEATAAIYETKLPSILGFSSIPESERNKLEGRILGLIETHAYLEPFEICEGASAMFVNAGHIPGSASVVVSLDMGDETSVVTFSGDLGSGHHPFLDAPDTETLSKTVTSTLVVESTYGADAPRDYPEDDADLYKRFWGIIRSGKERGFLVIIPTFSLDRTQRVVEAILEGQRTLDQTGEPFVPELRLAIGGRSSCDLTYTYLRLLRDPTLCGRYFAVGFCEDCAIASTELEYLRGDCCCGDEYEDDDGDIDYRMYDVIVTPSGNGTRPADPNTTLSNELLKEFIGQLKVVVVKVGWAPEWTPMGQLREKNPPLSIRMDEEWISLAAEIYEVHDVFSGHADISALVDYVTSFPELEQVIIVHGDDNRDARLGLEEALKASVDWPALVQILRPRESDRIGLD